MGDVGRRVGHSAADYGVEGRLVLGSEVDAFKNVLLATRRPRSRVRPEGGPNGALLTVDQRIAQKMKQRRSSVLTPNGTWYASMTKSDPISYVSCVVIRTEFRSPPMASILSGKSLSVNDALERGKQGQGEGHARSIVRFQDDIAGGIRVSDARPCRLVAPNIIYGACEKNCD